MKGYHTIIAHGTKVVWYRTNLGNKVAVRVTGKKGFLLDFTPDFMDKMLSKIDEVLNG